MVHMNLAPFALRFVSMDSAHGTDGLCAISQVPFAKTSSIHVAQTRTPAYRCLLHNLVFTS